MIVRLEHGVKQIRRLTVGGESETLLGTPLLALLVAMKVSFSGVEKLSAAVR